jgi:hypothetical protein
MPISGINWRNILRPPPPEAVKAVEAAEPSRPLPDTLRLKRQHKHLLRDNRQVQLAAAQLQELPREGESLHCVMSGAYHGWSLIPAFLDLVQPATVARLTMTTLGFSARNGEHLLRLLDAGRIGTATLLCSCYFRDSSPEIFGPLQSALAARQGCQLAAARCHAKIVLLATSDNRKFVIESSANLRSCQSIEQFSLIQDGTLYDFHAAWIADVLAKV